MRFVFGIDGKVQAIWQETPPDPYTGPGTAIDAELSAPLAAGALRAQDRITLANGRICLDGQPYTPPAELNLPGYATCIAAIPNMTTNATMRLVLRAVVDMALLTGMIEL